MLPIYYATYDGHSHKVAQTLAEELTKHGVPAQVVNVVDFDLSAADVVKLPLFVLVAAVRYGHHLPQGSHALARVAAMPQRPPLAVVSLNLTARKPHKRTLETNPYVKKWLTKLNIQPDFLAIFAGKLDYPRYNWWDKQMIRLIMTLTSGETDPKAVVDYTDWQAVRAFAGELVIFLEKAKKAA